MSVDKITTAQENSSVPLSNNTNPDSNSYALDNCQLKAESKLVANEHFQSSMNLNESQTNFSAHNNSFSDVNHSMSSLSMHDVRSTNRSNSTHFRLHPSYPYHHTTQAVAHPTLSSTNTRDTQAQLVAFTPPLMSIRLPHTEYQTYESSHYQPRSYIHNQSNEQLVSSTQCKSETVTTQPEYYVDSFASNFSDKPSSNSNNKTKTKHVTFQEPNITNNLSKANSDHFTYAPSSSNSSYYSPPHWPPPTHIYPPSRLPHRFYNPYQHPMHNQFHSSNTNMIINSRFMARPRPANMMSTYQSRMSTPYHTNQQAAYTDHRFQQRQLYDPNKPKVPTLYDTHNASKVIRNIVPKNKKKNKQADNSNISLVPTSEPVLHPITILRKPTNGVQSSAQSIFILPPPPVQDRSIASFDEELQTTSSISADPSDIPCKKEQLLESLSEIPLAEEQIVSSSIDDEYTAQSTSNTVLSLSAHEILSILQSTNCLSSLNDFAQQKKFTLNYEFSSVSPSSFTCQISIDGRAFPTSSICSSKIEAQKIACDQALRTLYRESCMNEQSSPEFSNKHDCIAHRSVSTFQALNINGLLFGRKTLACMLMVTDKQYAQGDVISIGTGNTCLDETNLIYADDGVALHDCHAEILARRGLIRYLFEQIKQCQDNKTSIFEYNSTMNKFQLQENVTFHLYISSLPCGNASFNTSSNSIRYKQGQTEGTILGSTKSVNYSIKSCSDKIYRWNILGIQGGLLINLLAKPIYLDTITLACETAFVRDHVKYALCDRLNEYIHSLPSPFLCHVPDIDCPTNKSLQQERQVAKLQANAFAWNITQPDRMELLEPMTGKLKNDRCMSLLSNQNLLKDFTGFIQTYFSHDTSLSFTTYQQAKQLNKTYVTVKDLISTAFQTGSSDTNLSWSSKSDQVEQFSVE